MSHPRGTRACVALVVLALLGLGRPAQAQVTLRYQFKEGEKLRYLLTAKLKMKVDADGKEVEIGGGMKIGLSLQTLKVGQDGKGRVLMKIERMQLNMGAEGMSFSFDTSSPDDLPEEVKESLQKMLKDGITMTMDPQGNSSDVKMPESWKELMQKSGKGPLGLDALTGKGFLGLVFPREPVTKGKKWKSEPLDVDLPPAGKLKGENSYTYDGPVKRGGRDLEKIILRQKLSLQPDPNSEAKLALKVNESPGALYFDNRRGQVVEAQQDMNMDLDMEADGMQARMKIEMKLHMKLLKPGK
jgi:hypothetical protein